VSQAKQVIDVFLEIITWIIVARIFLSWLPHNPDNPVIRILYEGTEPLLAPFRKIMPQSGLALDFSPLLLLLSIHLLRGFIFRL
jgi:YggT family protein